MKLYNNTPNFSIVMPGGCNARCAFCNHTSTKGSPDFVKKLKSKLDELGDVVTQISITGGEPTLSPYFAGVLDLLKNYQHLKIVLTTNGARIPENIELICSVVDHINISRHKIRDFDNCKVFGTYDVLCESSLSMMCSVANLYRVDVTINKFLSSNHRETDEIGAFISFAKDVGATSVCFRKDHFSNDLSMTPSESSLSSKYREEKCPVCVTREYIINGIFVYFKAGMYEPSEHIDDIFEFVFQPDGELYADWNFKKLLPEGLGFEVDDEK